MRIDFNWNGTKWEASTTIGGTVHVGFGPSPEKAIYEVLRDENVKLALRKYVRKKYKCTI